MRHENAIQVYLQHKITVNCRPGTIQNCRRVLTAFTSFTDAPLASEVTPRHVSAYISHKLTKGTKPTTVKNHRGIILCWLAWLTEEEYIEDRQWSKRVKQIKCESDRAVCMTPEQCRKFLLTAENMPYRSEQTKRRTLAMLYLFLDTALRETELLTLRMVDIDIEGCCVVVKASIAKGRRCREVPFTTETRNLIRAYLRSRRKVESEYLWVTRDHKHPSRSLILQTVKRIGRACGMPDLTVHGLRHTAATMLLRNGMSLVAVSRLLGHAQVRTTEGYLHLLNDDIRTEYAKAGPIARLLSG